MVKAKFKRNDIVIRISDNQRMVVISSSEEMTLCQWNKTKLESAFIPNSYLKLIGQNPRVLRLK